MHEPLLRQVALFATLDDGELARIAEICREQSYHPGQTIFKEGEPGNRLFLILEGDVRISRDIPGSGEEGPDHLLNTSTSWVTAGSITLNISCG